MHVVRLRKLGVPQQSRDAFVMMQEASLLDVKLAERMQAMVGFRNIAVHDFRDYSSLEFYNQCEMRTHWVDMVYAYVRVSP